MDFLGFILAIIFGASSLGAPEAPTPPPVVERHTAPTPAPEPSDQPTPGDEEPATIDECEVFDEAGNSVGACDGTITFD